VSDAEEDPYAAVGVDYGVIDPGKVLAQRAAFATRNELQRRDAREVEESRGESAYVVDVGDRYLVTVTEALGTKNLVADAVREYTGKTHYEAVAQDAVATVLNDLSTLGARPLCLTAYWGAGSSDWFADSERLGALVAGWQGACRKAHCAWGGGETQVLKGIIDEGAVVLGGSGVGFARRSELLLGSRVQAGDALLIAPSTGIHTNGLTLARDVATRMPQGYRTPVPGDAGGRSFGEALLDPTPLYGALVEALLDAGVHLHYTVHVTGHGWRKLMRSTRSLRYVVDVLPAVPPVLALLVKEAALPPSEAYGTFNMGAGFVLYLSESDVETALATAASEGFPLLRAGHVENGPRSVVVRPLGVIFEGDSLTIR